MDELFRTIERLPGLTPPLSPQGKRFATYGDAVIRERVMRILIKRGETDLSAAASQILSRSNQAELVRQLDLFMICAMPIAWYTGNGPDWNEHTVSTVLESVVGEAVLGGCDEFATGVAYRLIDLYDNSVPNHSPIEVPQKGQSEFLADAEPVANDGEDKISSVYQWAARNGRKVAVKYRSTSAGYECRVDAGSISSTGTGKSKKEAKRLAFAYFRCDVEEVPLVDDGDNDEVFGASAHANNVLNDTEEERDPGNPGFSESTEGHFDILAFVEEHAPDFDDEAEPYVTDPDLLVSVHPPVEVRFCLETWLSQ